MEECDVTAVDLTPRSIETSRRHLELYGQTGEFAIADCERLPFADESFDEGTHIERLLRSEKVAQDLGEE